MAQGRHKRDTDARRFNLKPFTKPSLKLSRATLVAVPVAVAATTTAVTVGVLGVGVDSGDTVAAADIGRVAPSSSPPATTPAAQADRVPVSRSLRRTPAQTAADKAAQKAAQQAARQAATKAAQAAAARAVVAARRSGQERWTTTDLNLWTQAGQGSTQDGLVKAGTKVLATGRNESGRDEILVDGALRWVTAGYLSDQKPAPAPAGLSDAPCPDTSVENGLKPQTVKVYRAVCHAFPQVKDYGGLAPRTEHDTGNAIDVMVYGDKALGDQIAAWVQAHAADFDLYDLIWYDRIWTPVRSSEGWRDYGDHGSATANHMDHVHIGTN